MRRRVHWLYWIALVLAGIAACGRGVETKLQIDTVSITLPVDSSPEAILSRGGELVGSPCRLFDDVERAEKEFVTRSSWSGGTDNRAIEKLRQAVDSLLASNDPECDNERRAVASWSQLETLK